MFYCRLAKNSQRIRRTYIVESRISIASRPSKQQAGSGYGLFSCLLKLANGAFSAFRCLYMGGCQNYGPVWGPNYNTAPNI